ncbi:MAG TPA: M13 family metallopeptidase [Longimicrobiaceae bacterium]|nr:M13 family metallopeptidase [Longimicrobiaceae bacterium]
MKRLARCCGAAAVALLAALGSPAHAQPLRAAAPADTTCPACRDFYRFANQQWLDTASIPAEYPAWGSFEELAERNRRILRGILEHAAADTAAAAGSDTYKLGTYYATCMDSAAAERAGAAPLQPELARIQAISTPEGVVLEAARLQTEGVGALLDIGSGQDDRNSAQVVLQIVQGGLGLPDRDYYTKTDSASEALRTAYVEHVARTLQLLGETPAAARSDADQVMRIETALANASMTRVQRRDPEAVYHKLSTAQLRTLAPSVDWTGYFRAVDAPVTDSLLVRQPDFVAELSKLVAQQPLPAWRAYLRWHLAQAESPRLSSAFVNEAFHFNQRLYGTKKLQERWKRCLAATDDGLGEMLGKAYVKETFTPEAKARALSMVHNLEAALRDRIGALAWMSDSTKQQALLKLDAFTEKIGYPDKWRDYSALRVTAGSFVDNAMRADRFEFERDMAKIGKPVDRTEWGMTPPTVNAYYNPSMNEIVFPAGILQPPFFDPNADDATNYGAMGAVIGHEMTHGFDDQGRKYDAQGNLHDWWTPEDAKRFDARADLIRSQFGGYVAVDTLHLNGKLTSGENIADLGGLTVAYAALQKDLAGKPRATIDGYTPEQRFFLSWAHIWRELRSPEYSRLLVTVDPHSPGQWRVNGPLSNMPEFAKAFGCQAGDPMVRPEKERVQIW